MLLAFSVLMLLSMMSYDYKDVSLLHSPPNQPPMNFIGPVGAWFTFGILMVFGIGGYLLPVAMGATGLMLVLRRDERLGLRVLWMFVLLVGVDCLLELQADLWEPLRASLNLGSPGGIVGYVLAHALLIRLLGAVGTGILVAGVLVASMIFLFEVRPVAVGQWIAATSVSLYKKMQTKMVEEKDARQRMDREARTLQKRRDRLEKSLERQVAKAAKAEEKEESPPPFREPVAVAAPEPAPMKEPNVMDRLRRRPAEPKPPAPVEEVAIPELPAPGEGEYVLPSMDLLDPLPPAHMRAIQTDFKAGAALLQETLAEFGIEGEVTNVEQGPVVTRYEILPAPGIRVERIAGLSNNIALAMKAEAVRVQAPIPGKGVVGIEVPNPTTTMVCLREILESGAWDVEKMALPLGLGKDVGGREIVADLADMPHMLVAGATGAGKTVCMNSILAGLLMFRTPEQMRLLLVDPKIVEFSAYNNLPHLVVPVITDPKKVGHGLRWAIDEMEKRYKMFAKTGVRNIRAYNTRPIVQQGDLFGEEPVEKDKDKLPDRLPYIVLIVDELADLMLVAQAEVENHIARLAQLSRAVGIHMILATQRPSVNVITGTIKANFPARIAFKVSQKVDSRTILDANGADKLLGKGDMLFLPPGSHKLIRAQGTMTSDGEITKIVDFIKEQGQPKYEIAIKEKMESSKVDIPDAGEDDLMETAIEIIRQTKRASTSSLQRRLRIGYTRAARLMDLLEEKGVVGPPRGADPREILIDLDGTIPTNAESEAGEEGV